MAPGLVVVAAICGSLVPHYATAQTIAPRVAIIVGPVGESLTPTYLGLAEGAAAAAEADGATVARAYSPNATPQQVLSAVAGANIVVYFGHGTGFPNPYSDTLNPDKVNGWGLQGPKARGTHEDSLADGTLAYYGEAWIAEYASPAPGFVMIYSNVCYAPGAGEGGDPPSSAEVARQRAGGYARTPLGMGASAVFATDFYAGAAELVDRLLSDPTMAYGDIVRSGSNYAAEGVTVEPHPYAADAELWLQRSPYFGGKSDYWFAFSGDSTASFASAGTARPDALLAAFEQPLTLRLQPGEHLALRVDRSGAVVDEMRWTTDAVTELMASERRHLPDLDGTWYRIAEGEHAGAWVAESPTAHLAGLALETPLQPARVVQFAAGTHAGYTFANDGTIESAMTATLPRASRATADALALIDGQLHVRIADGTWADHWLLVSDAVRLAGPVPLPPQTPAPSATVAPSAAPAPIKPGAPPPTPPPSADASAEPAPAGSPQPTSQPSSPPSASPTPSATPSPSASPTPSATPLTSASASPSPSP